MKNMGPLFVGAPGGRTSRTGPKPALGPDRSIDRIGATCTPVHVHPAEKMKQ